MSVRIATRVFGSEVLVGLIRHYRRHPDTTQREASVALELQQQMVSVNVRILIDSAVLVEQRPPATRDGRAKYYRVDEQRIEQLLDALTAYTLTT